jgi:hypothetical protein
VDHIAAVASRDYGYECVEHLAQWNKYGSYAGYMRNTILVDNCDMVVAFWNGLSRGTFDAMQKAQRANKSLHVPSTYEDVFTLAASLRFRYVPDCLRSANIGLDNPRTEVPADHANTGDPSDAFPVNIGPEPPDSSTAYLEDLEATLKEWGRDDGEQDIEAMPEVATDLWSSAPGSAIMVDH